MYTMILADKMKEKMYVLPFAILYKYKAMLDDITSLIS